MVKKYSKIIIILAILFLINLNSPYCVKAQELDFPKKEAGGMGYFMFGTQMIDVIDLNTRLEAQDYPVFSENFISFGSGGHGIINNKLIIGIFTGRLL